ncbi:restriction endonuclease subunit S [Patescibacteria group bacterium]
MMKNNKKQKNTVKIPKLRFGGFDGEWEEKRLGRIADFWNGKAHEQDISEDGKYIVVNSKFISQNGKVKKYSDSQISPLKKEDITIVMSDIPNGKAIGKCFLVDQNDKYTLNQRIGGIKSEEIISSFLIRILNRNKYFLKSDNGVSQTNLRKDEILRCPLILPLLKEQQKIAGFLGEVDEWIGNLREQKENLESYKKGMMQKIFSQKIRFKDENGKEFLEWEEKKLGEVLKIGSGRDYKHLGSGNIPVFGTGGYMLSVDKALYDGESVLIGRKGTIDKPFYYDGKFWTVDTLFYTRDFKNVIPKFVSLVFQKINWLKYNEASGVPSLSRNTIEKIKTKVPQISEQQKIAEFLTSIDEDIELKQQQITQAEQWKKGLMHGLFV